MTSIYDPNIMNIVMDYVCPPWEHIMVINHLRELFDDWVRDDEYEFSFPTWLSLKKVMERLGDLIDDDYDYNLGRFDLGEHNFPGTINVSNHHFYYTSPFEVTPFWDEED